MTIPSHAPNVATQSATASTTNASAPAPAGLAAFVLTVTASDGDKATVEGRFAPLVPADQSGIEASGLEGCQGASDRDYAIRLDLTATVESSLPATVSLLQFEGDNWAPKNMDIVLDAEGALSCQVSGDSEVTFGQLQPHQAGHQTVWLILPEAITPDEPHPEMRKLTAEYRLKIQKLEVAESATDTPTATGSQIASCINVPSATDKFIAISTEVARTMKNVTGEEETECET